MLGRAMQRVGERFLLIRMVGRVDLGEANLDNVKRGLHFAAASSADPLGVQNPARVPRFGGVPHQGLLAFSLFIGDSFLNCSFVYEGIDGLLNCWVMRGLSPLRGLLFGFGGGSR